MINIETVKNAVSNKIFMGKYAQGRNYPLNFCYYRINVYELANGEYNYNYKLDIKIEYEDRSIQESAVLRINYGSQMNLENQIEYEYNALEYLKETGVTPVPILMDLSKELLEKEYLIMEFIEGNTFDYKSDMYSGAECLSKIHKYKKETEFKFIEPEDPFSAILEECKNMYSKYEKSSFFDNEIDMRIKVIFSYIEKRLKENESEKKSEKVLINTELNSSNFIMGDGKCYLIDWEKPIIGEKEQDLGHFLAPTTTFWKTDVVLSKKEIDKFIEIYYKMYYNRKDACIEELNLQNQYTIFKEKVYKYIVFNCLRGLTWCSMAWVEYNNSEKALINEFTYNKLKEYLKLEYIDNIIESFIKN